MATRLLVYESESIAAPRRRRRWSDLYRPMQPFRRRQPVEPEETAEPESRRRHQRTQPTHFRRRPRAVGIEDDEQPARTSRPRTSHLTGGSTPPPTSQPEPITGWQADARRTVWRIPAAHERTDSMLAVNKHPAAAIVAIADFGRQLAPGETLVSIATQPTVSGPDAVLVVGDGAINDADVELPEGLPTVIAFEGVKVPLSAGTNRTGYKVRVQATTNLGNSLVEDCTVYVSA